jgi:predicted enzyme related to lactoylglutathione lyase
LAEINPAAEATTVAPRLNGCTGIGIGMGPNRREGEVVLLRLHAREPARAARFYAGLFGWTVGASTPSGLGFHTPGGLAGVFRVGEPSTAGPEIYVRVARLEPALARAVELGGVALVRPGPAPDGGRVAQVLDPEGNRIGLFEAPGDPVAEGEPTFPSDDSG